MCPPEQSSDHFSTSNSPEHTGFIFCPAHPAPGSSPQMSPATRTQQRDSGQIKFTLKPNSNPAWKLHPRPRAALLCIPEPSALAGPVTTPGMVLTAAFPGKCHFLSFSVMSWHCLASPCSSLPPQQQEQELLIPSPSCGAACRRKLLL